MSRSAQVCKEVADKIEEKGADAACEALGLEPPLTELCSWLAEKAAGEMLKLLAHGYNSEDTCKQLGMCPHLGHCACGECASVSTGRCLSLPNHCPSHNPLLEAAPPALRGQTEHEGKALFCADHKCDSGRVGCCLTCF